MDFDLVFQTILCSNNEGSFKQPVVLVFVCEVSQRFTRLKCSYKYMVSKSKQASEYIRIDFKW